MNALNVKSLVLRGFMSHTDTTIEFPKTGTVCVTGVNGAGKSSIVEAVSVALWGKTLRGTDPWSSDAGLVQLETRDGLVVTRTRKKGKVTLSWSLPGAKAVEYETNTKAQEALTREVGEWDVWRRAAVFSSTDAAHFTLAPDAERKRLLESVLGLDRFDRALDACRKDLKRATTASANAGSALAVLCAKLTGERARVADAQVVLDREAAPVAPAPPGDVLARLQKARALLAGAEADVAPLREQARRLEGAAVRGEAEVVQLRAQLAKLHARVCPTCEQAIPDARAEHLRAQAAEAETKAAAAGTAARDGIGAVQADLEELDEQVSALRKRVTDLDAQRAAHEQLSVAHVQAMRRREAAQATLAGAEAGAQELEDKVQAADGAVALAAAEQALLEACERVLDTRGVRAHVLARALDGLQAVASTWLSRLSGGSMGLTIAPYSEKSGGGVKDAISINITGAGNGNGYAAASGGERRRVDVALIWALGEVAAGARGVAPGTLFADEVFDALDEDGAGYTTDAMRELAADRCVLVVAHNRTVVQALSADEHWTVDSGQLIVS